LDSNLNNNNINNNNLYSEPVVHEANVGEFFLCQLTSIDI
jgi:hypothetical protein